MASLASEPEHPILPKAWEYEILGFNLQRADDPPHIDLTLRRQSDGIVRRLRFPYPQDIFIERGFTGFTSGLLILDVRGRGLEGLSVQVTDFEAVGGAIGFWARDVFDLDAIR